jgi:seryl-tRNA synthetase
MKYFVVILFLSSCQLTAQKPDPVVKEDEAFKQLLEKVESNNKLSMMVQKQAAQKQTQIVTQTISKIVTLKEENKDLKVELNETKAKLDSVSTDTIVPFVLLPIPR